MKQQGGFAVKKGSGKSQSEEKEEAETRAAPKGMVWL